MVDNMCISVPTICSFLLIVRKLYFPRSLPRGRYHWSHVLSGWDGYAWYTPSTPPVLPRKYSPLEGTSPTRYTKVHARTYIYWWPPKRSGTHPAYSHSRGPSFLGHESGENYRIVNRVRN